MANPVDIFLNEVNELLIELEDALMVLESSPCDKEMTDSVFRVMHTIKGTSGMFGYTALSELTHYLEELFDDVRGGRFAINEAMINLALQCKDEIEQMLEADKNAGTPNAKTLISEIQTVREAALLAANEPAMDDGDDVTQAIEITIIPNKESLTYGLKPLPILRELSELGSYTAEIDISRLNENLDTFSPDNLYLAWTVTLDTTASLRDIQDVFIFVCDDWDIKIKKQKKHSEQSTSPELTTSEDITADSTATASSSESAASENTEIEANDDTSLAAAEAETADIVAMPSQSANNSELSETQPEDKANQKDDKSAPATTSKRVTQSIKVDASKLDDLMDMVGEMVIAQTRLTQLASQYNDPEFENAAENMGRLIDHVRDTSLSMRMLPVGHLFNRFKRLIRDASRDLNKKINLEVEGEDTELDKTVLDRLADSVVHLIRNSVDHGIESPDVRVQNGKPETGTIRMVAAHVDSNVVITITDDGGGIPTDVIARKAVEKGLIAENHRLSEKEILQLIFEPGFSTADKVSQLSGRGVGMDAVKKAIEALGGNVEISSVVNEGTQTVISLPLTMAIIEGLHVRVNSSDFIIPLSKVNECIESTDTLGAVDVLNLRGECVPQISLGQWFSGNSDSTSHAEIVIAKTEKKVFGLAVDQIVGQQQTVVKSLSPIYENVSGISGATILGDGNVALILDVENLFHAVSMEQQSSQRAH